MQNSSTVEVLRMLEVAISNMRSMYSERDKDYNLAINNAVNTVEAYRRILEDIAKTSVERKYDNDDE